MSGQEHDDPERPPMTEVEQLRAKLARVDALCERWRAKPSTASAGAALRLTLDDQ